MQLVIKPNGLVRCVYDETIDLRQLGHVSVQRGSKVEPDDAGNWFADLAIVNGPTLGPFHQRSEALAAERQWLECHWLTRS